MKQAKHPIAPLLERMGRIERMERGKVCRMTGRSQYNHQTWLNGRNVVRYVPTEELAALQAAIDGYRLFMKLARQHADQIIQRTRSERPQPSPRPKASTHRKSPPSDKAPRSSAKHV